MVIMKAVFPPPIHESYQRHRKQRTGQIILPVIVGTLLFLALVVLAIIGTANGGDVGRWAAVSTIWISIPVCLIGFVFLILLVGMVYLMGRLLGVAPRYTNQAQNFVRKLAIRIRLAADMTVRPIIALNGYGATLKTLLGRK
jgi:Kef-type K+ transport system membrane component KefB